jgi:hypothetical protein
MMAIKDTREYKGAKEYVQRLSYILADGSSFLQGDDLELFSASLNHELATVRRAIEEYEARTFLVLATTEQPAVMTQIIIEGGVGFPEQPSASWAWTLPVEHGGVFSTSRALRPDPQLRLFTFGRYTEEPSVVFGRSLEDVGLAA